MAKVKGLSIDIGVTTRQFDKGIRKMNREIKNTNREVGTLARSLQVDFDANRFARAQQQAQKSLEMTDQKAETLRARLKHLEDTGQTDTAHYEKTQQELSKTEARAVNLKQRLRELDQIRIDALAKNFEELGQKIESAGQKMKPFSKAAGAVLASFSAIGLSAVQAGDEIGTTAQQLNISAESLQRWRYVAQQTDVDISQLTNSIRRMQMGLGGVASGELDETSKALVALGFTQEDALKGMEANFEDIMYSLADMEDATLQAHYANELFGRRMGAQMIPLLNDGTAGLQSIIDEFEGMNYMTEEEINQLDAFEDVMDRVTYALKTMKDQIGFALMPMMESMAEFIESRVLPAVQRFADFFSSLSETTKTTMAVVLASVTALAPALIILGKLTAGIGGLIRSTFALRGALTALAAHPIILAVGVAVGLLALLYKRNEEFRNTVNNLVQTLSSALAPVLESVVSLFRSLMTAVKPIMDALMAVLNPLLTVTVTILETLFSVLTPIIQVLSKLMAPALALVGWYFEKLGSVIQKFLIPVIELWGKVVTSVFEFVQKQIEKIMDFIVNMANNAISFINKIIDGINALGSVIGVEIGRLDDLEMKIEKEVTGTAGEQPDRPEMDVNLEGTEELSATVPEQALTQQMPEQAPQTSIEQDNRQQSFEVQIDVYTMGEELDTEDLARQINRELAKQM